MICKNCGWDVPGNDRFCTNCGAEMKAAPSAEEAGTNNYGYSSQTNGNFYGNTQNNGGYYAGNPGNNAYQQGYRVPPVNNNAPSLKEYLKWMLLYPLWNFVPAVGFIIYIVVCIKYALDNTYTARANFFKAMLITQLIGIGVAVVVFVVMFALMGVGLLTLEELEPSFFVDEFYYSYPAMFIR